MSLVEIVKKKERINDLITLMNMPYNKRMRSGKCNQYRSDQVLDEIKKLTRELKPYNK